MKQVYVVIYYKDGKILHESKPMDRVSYPAGVSVRNRTREEYDYAVIEERYYPV